MNKTPQSEYRKPILDALQTLGGRGKVDDVLTQVHQRMKRHLTEVDYELLKSKPHEPRWRNTARWERKNMVTAGLLQRGSARGIWELR